MFHSTTRLLYDAGLEHTGHHFFTDSLVPILSIPHFSRPFFESSSCDNATYMTENTEALFASLTGINALLGYSYPCFASCVRLRPNLVYLAKSAEQGGTDLRVLYMTRPAGFLLHECSPARVNVLTDMCYELLFQMEHLDPAFFHCFPYYEPIGDPENDFLGINATSAKDKAFTPHRHIEPTCRHDPPLRRCLALLDKRANCAHARRM